MAATGGTTSHILTVRLVDALQLDGHTQYGLEVVAAAPVVAGITSTVQARGPSTNLPAGKWLLRKRYSEFVELHEQLLQHHKQTTLPKLPPKRVLALRSAAFVEQRRQELQTYMQALTALPAVITSPAFVAFLVPSRDVLVAPIPSATGTADPISVPKSLVASAGFAELARTQSMQSTASAAGASSVGSAASASLVPNSKISPGSILAAIRRKTATVIYASRSVCPRCVIRDPRRPAWLPAAVVSYRDAIWLVTECSQHGAHETLYCTDPRFFDYVQAFDDIAARLATADTKDVIADYEQEDPDEKTDDTARADADVAAPAPVDELATDAVRLPSQLRARRQQVEQQQQEQVQVQEAPAQLLVSADTAASPAKSRDAGAPPTTPRSDASASAGAAVGSPALGCPVPLPPTLPLEPAVEQKLARFAMEGPDQSALVAAHIGWNYWVDGPLPPSHPSSPFRSPAGRRPARVTTSASGRVASSPAPSTAVGRQLEGLLGSTLPDVDDLDKACQLGLPVGTNPNLPLIVDVALTAHGVFRPNRELEAQLRTLLTPFPMDHSIVVRVNAALVTDVTALNDKVKFIVSLLAVRPARCPVWIQGSCAILQDLVQVADSVLLHATAYPELQVLLEQGSEEAALAEVQAFVAASTAITQMQVVLNLIVDRPFPRFELVMPWIRAHPGLLRLVMIHVERAPARLHAMLQQPAASSTVDTVDPMELLHHIAAASGHQLQPLDFFPVSVMRVLEPLLRMCGYGNFAMHPASYCGFVTVLVNTDALKSVPVSRIFDILRLYEELLTYVSTFPASKTFTVGVANALRKIFRKCLVPGAAIPNLLRLLAAQKVSHVIIPQRHPTLNRENS